MPDISMCQNYKCKISATCYRFTATPSHHQFYTPFNEENCEFHMPIFQPKDKRNRAVVKNQKRN